MRWYKKSLLSYRSSRDSEVWIREDNNGEQAFPVELYLGKKTNLVGLKKDLIETIKKQLAYYKSSREELYSSSEMEEVLSCPVTGISTAQADPVATIYNAEYVQTPDTAHVYLKQRPTESAINNFYLNNVTYAATYTNKDSAEFRLNSIAVPWLNWLKKVYYEKYGVEPRRILDVGSGAGHFVEACRRAGIEASGVELSEASRDFAKEIWGVELDGRNFFDVVEDYKGYDIVTFWGLLEHTPFPGKILDTAHKIVSNSDRGMVVAKVPRWNSLSSASQRLNPDTIIRHIDPMGHIMLFTDASASELYLRSKFKPVAAWYYGMDIYETFMQLGNRTGLYDVLTKTGDFQMELQQYVDEQRFSDGLTLVGVPLKE